MSSYSLLDCCNQCVMEQTVYAVLILQELRSPCLLFGKKNKILLHMHRLTVASSAYVMPTQAKTKNGVSLRITRFHHSSHMPVLSCEIPYGDAASKELQRFFQLSSSSCLTECIHCASCMNSPLCRIALKV
mmetsp:Transcript_14347/g.25349  ORF Transcript_14347/g.25349 Transcript_14347/m.25349 type:complete len:131 (+) Transcript_14347:333-725(+)